MIEQFKKFAMRGNVIDLATGVIIGAAFGKIVSSFVEDLITPLILKPALDAARLNNLEHLTAFGSVKYGVFLAAVINFVIVAFVLALFVRVISSIRRKDDAVPAPPPADVQLLTEIRDLLKAK